MTREEQIKHEVGSLADFAIAHGAPWKEYHNGFIDGAKWADEHPAQHSLPSDLDEAAEEALNDVDANWQIDERDDGCTEPGYNQKQMLLMFKAGAKWLAGQGETRDDITVTGDFDNKAHIFPIPSSKFNPGDKVVVQIRKK